jgi:LysR family transcriptional activator of nhaA
MDRLNYHHLLYFFTVAREGSVARASQRLGLAQPTVSAQIHALEQELGRKLLERSGRGLKVTPAGETVLRYAASIFALGGELRTALDGEGEAGPALMAGVSSSLPPALAAMLLQAVLAQRPRPHLAVVEASSEALLAQLVARSLHCVLTDAPAPNAAARGLQSRLLCESPVGVFAPEALARKLRKDFPAHLSGLSVLMVPSGVLRQEVERWLSRRELAVQTMAEMPHPEVYARAAGAAIFAPMLLRRSLRASHGLVPLGELDGLRWRVYVCSPAKGARPPGLEAMIAVAKSLE